MNTQTKFPEYKGYETIAMQNNKIVVQIKNNLHESEVKSHDILSKKFLYEPPIRFVFKNYKSMVEFIDENPK